MKQLNIDPGTEKPTGFTTALPPVELSCIKDTCIKDIPDLTELIRSGKVTREGLSAAIEQMDKEQHRQEILSRHTQAIFQGKDGRWRTTLRKSDGTRQDLRKATRAELENYLVAFYDRSDDHKTARDVFMDWIREKEEFREIKGSSLARYKTDFRRFFTEDDEFCSIEMKDITEAHLERFIKRQIVKHGLTHKTYGGLRIILMGIFKRAKRDKLTSISITAFFGDLAIPDSIFARPANKTDAEEVFTDAEERRLLSWLREEPTLQKLGVVLMFQTGLRVGELSALKRSDIDISRMCITVRRTETSYDDPDGHRVIDVSEEAKTEAGNRVVYLPETAKSTFRQILQLNPLRKWLFSYENGRRMHGKVFNDQIHRACKAVGIPERSTHKIRKTYASALLDGAVNEKLVQKQMGHSDSSTTKRYYRRDRMTEADKLAEINRIVNM